MNSLINLKYINNSFIRTGKILPSSQAITWCMLATSVNRIFTKEDLRELLFRMAIKLHSTDLIETWLIKGQLIKYTVREFSHILTVEDLIMHIGLEVIDSADNLCSRGHFLEHIEFGIQHANFIGAMEGISVINPNFENNDILSDYPVKICAPELTPDLIAKAEFFADDLMKFIPEEAFDNRSIAMVEKEMEIYERQERIWMLPIFDIKKIPPEIILQCLQIIYMPEYVEKLLKDPEKFEKTGKPKIYLGWLLANDFMVFKGTYVWPREGFPFDLGDYLLEGGGHNLRETIDIYNLEELNDLLKGIFINK